ncbi:hypothetical protein Z043_106721 [Scleropages formosus]|uniref:Protein FAM98B-like n=1 Tax=Scleropages formosus TaxID=113540 RepID=A0A0N8K174_SCLFO|nr:hypothetical protein Z043_106721 [Scleropages formosus]
MGYSGNVCLKRCGCEELPCPLVTWLVWEHRTSCPEIRDSYTSSSAVGAVLVGELRDLLAELRCPFPGLDTETLNLALLDRLTEFLISELEAVRILQYRNAHPEEAERADGTEKEQRAGWVEELQAEGSRELGRARIDEGKGEREELEKEWKLLLGALDMDASSRLSDVTEQVESRLALLPSGHLPGPLLKTSLSSEQWSRLQQISHSLTGDYECRRDMLVKRFQVTLQSFTWGDKGQERSMMLSAMTPPSPFSTHSRVSMSLILAAREDQSYILPVKAGRSTTVHKVLMGSVPDRGGRPGEIEPPMPMWEDRREGGARSHGRRQQRHWGSGKKSKNKKKQ